MTPQKEMLNRMADSDLTFYIGLLAGAIFFIDGWGPSEKDKGFMESRRFRGLAIIISGGIITPVLDYVSKDQKPVYFLGYLHGTVDGWLFVFLLGLFIYLFWKQTKDDDKKTFWYQAGEFAYSVLDFIYLGISENPHLDAKRRHDLEEYNLKSEDELDRLRTQLKEKRITPETVGENSKELAEFNKQLKNTKTEDQYNFDDWYLKGLAAYDKKQYEKTIAYMQNALEKNTNHPKAADAYLYMGLSYYFLELYDTSLKQYDKILSDYPAYANKYVVYYNKSCSYNKLGNYTDALPENEKSIQLNGNYDLAYINKGWILDKLNLYDDALIAYDKALELLPNDAPLNYSKAIIYVKQKDKENFLASLKKAIELNPANKEYAKTDEKLKEFWNDEDFKKLLS